jgi:hypothetical protein
MLVLAEEPSGSGPMDRAIRWIRGSGAWGELCRESCLLEHARAGARALRLRYVCASWGVIGEGGLKVGRAALLRVVGGGAACGFLRSHNAAWTRMNWGQGQPSFEGCHPED